MERPRTLLRKVVSPKWGWAIGRLRGWVAVVVGASSIGCGSVEDADGSKARESIYPYTNEYGDTFCSADRGDGAAEMYHFERMNESIRSSEFLSKAALDRGLLAVDSCETARIANELSIERTMAETTRDEAHAEIDAPVDKIQDGIPINTPNSRFVVRLSTPLFSLCSGSLLNGHYLLSAAHCFTNEPTQTVRVLVTDIDGSLHSIGFGTMRVLKLPGFSGVDCDPSDLALVRFDTGWSAPATNSKWWVRVFGRKLFEPATPFLYGYGAKSPDGAGGGVLRRTSGMPTVSEASDTMMEFVTQANVGRPCKGDSGGPAMTVTTEFPTVAGVFSCYQPPLSSANQCPGISMRFWYRQVGTVAASFIASTINSDAFSETCVNKVVGNYNYWTCF